MDRNGFTVAGRSLQKHGNRPGSVNTSERPIWDLAFPDTSEQYYKQNVGRFRADLFSRLNVVTIPLPPLRDRPEDVPELIAALLERHAREQGRPIATIDNATIRRLMAAPWPGNVRELSNALERAVLLADGPALSAADFPAELLGPPPDPGDDLRAAVATFERRHIARVLEASGGDKREAARRLGMGLSSLYRKLDEPDACP